jgi:hypothetical protein
MILDLTEHDIEAAITAEHYHQFPDTMITVCLLELGEGMAVLGDSACIDPAQFDRDTAHSIARAHAIARAMKVPAEVFKGHQEQPHPHPAMIPDYSTGKATH